MTTAPHSENQQPAEVGDRHTGIQSHFTLQFLSRPVMGRLLKGVGRQRPTEQMGRYGTEIPTLVASRMKGFLYPSHITYTICSFFNPQVREQGATGADASVGTGGAGSNLRNAGGAGIQTTLPQPLELGARRIYAQLMQCTG